MLARTQKWQNERLPLTETQRRFMHNLVCKFLSPELLELEIACPASAELCGQITTNFPKLRLFAFDANLISGDAMSLEVLLHRGVGVDIWARDSDIVRPTKLPKYFEIPYDQLAELRYWLQPYLSSSVISRLSSYAFQAAQKIKWSLRSGIQGTVNLAMSVIMTSIDFMDAWNHYVETALKEVKSCGFQLETYTVVDVSDATWETLQNMNLAMNVAKTMIRQ